jgi:hypothetical protein
LICNNSGLIFSEHLNIPATPRDEVP